MVRSRRKHAMASHGGRHYLLTLVYKHGPGVLNGSGRSGASVSDSYPALKLGCRGGWRILLIPGAAVAGLWYRTWLLTGVPMTSIFAGFFEKQDAG